MLEKFRNTAVVTVMTASLLIGLVLVVVTLVRMLRNARQPRTPTSPLTWRISNIPGDISKGVFENILKDLPTKMSTSLGANRPELLAWSFARSGHSEQSSVATATFGEQLAPSELESAIKRKVGSPQLRVDLNFFGLTPLADPENPAVDIIAVTGLAGHAFGSWKSRGKPYMWLRDFLPESIPNARILTYGYDTRLPGSQSTASILDLSKKLLESVKAIRSQQEKDRPLIFIGHSLGGLVVKQALVQAARGSPNDKDTFRACYALIFFGVPNRGLDTSSLTSMVKGQPNEYLVQNLKPSSPFLRHLHQQFYDTFTFEDSQIICIFETKETVTVEWSPKTRTWERIGRKAMMVPQTSAIHAGKNEKSHDQLSIDADHSDIVKFSDPSNSDYVIVKSRIKQLVDDAPIVIGERIADHRRKLSNTKTKYVKSLNAPDYVFFRDFQVEKPAEGTFQWVLRDNLVDSWLSKDESSFLWIRGSPGQGKTVLSKFLLNHLDDQPTNSQKPARVIYFFFYDQDERFQTVDSLLRSLIKQLLKIIDLSRHVANILEVDPSKESEDSLWGTLEEIIRVPVLGTIYCVLDALDECKGEESRKRLLWRFTRLLENPSQKARSLPVMKLLVTSRPIVDISRELDRLPCIDLKANPDDIKIFIKSKVADLNRFPADLQESAAELLLNRAGGTFLWVAIVLKNLKKMSAISRAELRTVIAQIPTDLDELYLRIVNQIMEGKENEQKLLAWVVYGRRPLTLKELEAALATQMDSKSWKSTDDHRVDPTLLILASGMSVILEITDDKVHLIHQSAKDFLLKNGQLSCAKFCNELDPNIYLAKVCMVYLSFKDFEAGPCGDRDKLAARKCQYPLYHYASRNWHAHIQGQDDIGDISSIVCRLTKPGSPILLAWGEAAEILDLYEATDMWGIATKADILWLAEFHSSDREIGEEKVEEAAKDGVKGYNRMRRLVKRGNVRFTGRAVHALARNFDQGIMQLLLDRNGDIKVSHELIKAAAVNQKSGIYVMALLLELSDDIALTDDLVEVAARNKESGKDIIELLLRKETIQIADGAVAAIAEQFDHKVIRLLADVRGDIKITEKMVKEATRVFRGGKEMIVALLDKRSDNFKITEGMVQIIARSFDKEVMGLLLDRKGDNIKITEEVVKAAAGNKDGKKMMRLLLDRKGDKVKITDEVVKTAAGNWRNGEKVIRLLLDRKGDEVKITDEVVKAAAGNTNGGEEVMKLLLDRKGENFKITERMVQIIAQSFDKEVMGLLLDRKGDNVKITEEVVKAAAGNTSGGEEVMKLLLDRKGENFKITERMVQIIARSFDEEVMGLLLDRKGDNVKITEEVVKTVVGNTRSGEEVIKLLLDRKSNNFKITEKIVQIIARSFDREVMGLLLDRKGDNVKITEEVVKAVAGNKDGKNVMRLLFDRKGDKVKITDEVVKAAAGNTSGEKVMRLLLNRKGDEVKITDGVVKAAAGNTSGGEKVMKLLLDQRGDNVKITEEVVKAAAGNASSGDKVMKLLFDRKSDKVKITEGMVQIIARSFDEEVMGLLLNRKGDEVKITDKVVKAAAGNTSGGEKVMKLLLDRRGDDVKITEEVVKAAAGNSIHGKEVIMLLLEQPRVAAFITEEVLKEAARNVRLAKDIIEVLVNRPGVELLITEGVLVSAAGNRHITQKAMALLIQQQIGISITERVLYAAATSGNEETLLLIEQKCGVDIRSSNLTSICRLFRSVRAGDKESVSELLALGLDPNHQDIFGKSPLWYSSSLSYVPVVCLLLQRTGIELDSRSNISGFTAIMAAADSGHQKVVELLLNAGANPDIQDNNGRTLLTIAQSKGLSRIVKILQSFKEYSDSEPKQEAGECEGRLV